jgi:dihydroorotase
MINQWHNCLYKRIVNRFGFFIGLILITFCGLNVKAQEIDLLLKGGHVIDPKNKIDATMDVAIVGGKILEVAAAIPVERARRVIDVTGMYVTPGLIDMHSHNFWGTNGDYYADGPNGLPPDGFTFRNGVTTVVDPGSMGWRNFPTYKKQTIDQSQTRVLVLLNIVGSGMRLLYEQDTNDMDPKLTGSAALLYKDYVVGIKTAHFFGGFTGVDRAVEASKQAGGIPVMIDFGDSNPPLSIEELFMKHLRPGDIYTHVYSSVPLREHILDSKGIIKPFVFEAQKKGIIFDVGMGGGSLSFTQLVPSFKQGFLPNTISTDLHSSSMNGGLKGMANLMSMFLSLGMSVQDVVLRTTWNPAVTINRKELGNLSPGAVADIAVFKVREGDYGFQDGNSRKMNGTKRIENELTLRAGRIVWNLNGLGANMWDAGPIRY